MAISQAAVKHLLDLGLPNYGFVTYNQKIFWADERRDAFVFEITALSKGCHVFSPKPQLKPRYWEMKRFYFCLCLSLAAGAWAWDAKWIGAPQAADPVFVKTFGLAKGVSVAAVKVMGVGFYEASRRGDCDCARIPSAQSGETW